MQEKGITKSTTGGQTLSAKDLIEAELAIICYCQQQGFPEEIAALSSGKDIVSKQSAIYKLGPWLDNGLLRVRRHKISKDQHVANLILRDLHQQLGHSWHNHIVIVNQHCLH